MRLGTCVDALNSSMASVGHPDLVIRLTVTLSRFVQAHCDALSRSIVLHFHDVLYYTLKIDFTALSRCLIV